MSRWTRWQIVVPRLLLVVVLLLAAQYALGRVARRLAAGSLQSAVNTPVDVSHARVSLARRQLVLGDLRIRTSWEPARSLIAADRCTLDFAAMPLLHKRAVVERGTLSGVRFSATLAADGQRRSLQPRLAADTVDWLDDHADEQARHWLERLDDCFQHRIPSQYSSLEQTNKLCARWPEQAAAFEARTRELQHRAANMQQAVRVAHGNPLRHLAFLKQLPDEVAALRADYARAAADLEHLAGSFAADRRTIILSRQQDEDRLRQQAQLGPIDANLLTAYLLREQVSAQVGELISVLRWVRQAVPAEHAPPRRPTRGSDVVFAGCQPAPSLLVRKLDVQGTARLGGQPVEFHGTLTDFTDAPALHANPIRLRVQAVGSLPLKLQATIDRTAPLARDELLADCQGVVMPSHDLGRPDGFALKLSPCVASLSISAQVEGEKLSGDLQLVQRQVQLTPLMAGQLSNVPIAAALRATLADLDALAVHVTLGGTLSEPNCSLWSNLGPAVAEAMERALRRAGDEHTRALLARARRQVDERLADLEQKIRAQQNKLAAQMTTATGELQRVAALQMPADRLSREQLGHQLPTGSLFR